MGASTDNFFKFPRTPHLFGSTGSDDDRHLDRRTSRRFLSSASLVVEEKLDGTNVGVHFTASGQMVLQCRGHEITEGMHPQYDLFKQWAAAKRSKLESIVWDRHVLYGEWLYAKHTIHYSRLPHFLIAFDIYDKTTGAFLDRSLRLKLLDGSGIPTIPVLHRGPLTPETLPRLVRPSHFGSCFKNLVTALTDNLMEGLYLRIEVGGQVAGRAKFVRPDFVDSAKQSENWQRRRVVPNELAPGVDIWW